ncbi:cyanophycinase [Pelagicoccus mobilis]|uniref:Cyanophycinase n=1 Tax=Pelagicoccus mobilis TaxID=415221 RepID=A0A934VPM6_9BACT|nr:cyanophycinase [Pelagicoccus mobilis]MBK1875975.1 cyanophycinase [Pelagicoccus mobilis]
MKRLVATLFIGFATILTCSASGPERYLTGNAGDANALQTSGGYALMGGGGDVDDAFRWLLRKSGGGDVVVLRASGSDGYNPYLFSELGETVDSVESLVFRKRKQAFDPEVAKTIEEAELIFLAGGDQSKYVRFWKDTPVEDLIHKHVKAGKPIGGSSAGLAILGHISYSAMHDGDLTSKLALKYPNHRYITLEDDFLKLPGLENVLTDSHFSDRARMGRLLIMLRKRALEHPEEATIGIGIDEATALCIDTDGTIQVMTPRRGSAYFVTIDTFSNDSIEGTSANVTRLTATPTPISFNTEALAAAGEQIRLQILDAQVKQITLSQDD